MHRGHYGTAPIDFHRLQYHGLRQALVCVLTRIPAHDDSFYRQDSVMIIDRLQTKESPGSFLSAIMAEAGCLRSKQGQKL